MDDGEDTAYEMRRVRIGIFARNVVLLTIAITATYYFHGDRYHFEWDWSATVMTTIFILLLSWCLTPSLRLDDGHLDDAGDSFALRVGKATKRGLRRLKIRF